MMRNRHAKILEISSYPPPHAGWGVRIQFVKRKLEHLGHYCHVLNIGKSRKFQSPEFVGVRNGWDYFRKVLRFCRQGYLVHMHMNGQSVKGVILTFLAELISLLCGRRCVLTFHAGADQLFFPKNKNKYMNIIFQLIFFIPKCIICNDNIVKKKISEYKIKEEKIYTIPAFSKQYMDFKPIDLSKEFRCFFKNRKPILATYLMLRPSFDIKTLLYAIKELTRDCPRLGVVLMGSNTTPEDLDPEEVTHLVQELEIEPYLFWTGDLPHEQFLTILSNASIFVRTHIYDGVCSSVLEALALGKPVVASENPHRPPGILTFKTGQPTDLADKVRQALGQNATRSSQTKTPEVQDTVDDEARLLLDLALGKGASTLKTHLWGPSTDVAIDLKKKIF